MKISTINVLVIEKYNGIEIHSYDFRKNPNLSTVQALDQFRRLVGETCDSLKIPQLTDKEMAAAMERESWDSHQGISIEVQRSVD
jgi:hypothetical protein